MIAFVVKRLLYGILVLLGIVVLISVLFMVLPDAGTLAQGQRDDLKTREAIEREMGLDKPAHLRLLFYLNDISPVGVIPTDEEAQRKYDFVSFFSWNNGATALVLKKPYLRRSYQSGRKVSEILGEALPNTAILALVALALAVVLGIPFGVASAVKKNSATDHTLMVVAILGISTPSFFSAIIIAWLFGYLWSNFTGLNLYGSLYDYDPFSGQYIEWKNLVLPALTLGIRPLAIITQLTRSSMLEVLSYDYIRTARAKGLSRVKVIYKHALRNALNPVLTAVSGWLASLLAGAFFVEYIFNWKGIGKITVDALAESDFPVVMGSVLLVSSLFVLINILVDVLYGILDPRIRY